MKSDEFMKGSAKRGYPISRQDLQSLYRHQLLVPLFYIDDVQIEESRIQARDESLFGANHWVFSMAAEGRVRDCAAEDLSTTCPFERPPDENRRGWWDGYIYSSWQLIRVPRALHALRAIERAAKDGFLIEQQDQFRCDFLALSALASPYLPEIIGRLLSPGESQEPMMREFISEFDTDEILAVAGFDPHKLESAASELLNQARMLDPMIEWWPLIRHSNIAGWEKLKGAPLHCLWLRVAAEVFLRAHEDLARNGRLEPLPNLDGVRFRQSLHDRITPHWENEKPLELELANFGLSPHPRVLLLAEGATEVIHFNALLSAVGLNRPDRVRIQNAESSKANPDLLARYVIAPRPGHTFSGYQWMLPPTVLVIAVDPENKWRTLEDQEKSKQVIRSAIEREVHRQGGSVTETELEHLVTIFVWPGESYEFANFTDDELLKGLVTLTNQRRPTFEPDDGWSDQVLLGIQDARSERCKIVEKVGRLGVPDDKVRLAEILLPTLMEKFLRESHDDAYTTPVFQVIEKVQSLYARFASGVFTFERKVE